MFRTVVMLSVFLGTPVVAENNAPRVEAIFKQALEKDQTLDDLARDLNFSNGQNMVNFYAKSIGQINITINKTPGPSFDFSTPKKTVPTRRLSNREIDTVLKKLRRENRIDLKSQLDEHIVKLSSPKWRVRFDGIMSLGEMGRYAGSAAPQLLRCLEDPNRTNALVAADALGKIGPQAIPGLIRYLDDRDPKVVALAIQALMGQKVNDESLIRKYRALYKEHSHPAMLNSGSTDICHNIEFGLAKIGGRGAARLSLDLDTIEANNRSDFRNEIQARHARSRAASFKEQMAATRAARTKRYASTKMDDLTDDGLFRWSETSGALYMRDPHETDNPMMTYRRQMFASYLTSRWGSEPIKVYTPGAVSKYGFDPSKPATTSGNLYEWSNSTGTFYWTNPLEFRNPMFHYRMQVDEYQRARSSWGHVPPVDPPGVYRRRR